MRVLVVTNMFPSPGREYDGIFIKRQVDALRSFRPAWDIEVAFVDTVAETGSYLTGNHTVHRVAKAFRPDLVHAHYGLSAVFCRWWDGPLVVTYHGSDVGKAWQRPVSRWAARRAAGNIAVSSRVRDLLGYDALIVPCGVDEELFHPQGRRQSRARLGIPADAYPVLLFPASPARTVKGFDLFEAALDVVRGSMPGVHALTLGDVAPEAVGDYLRAADCVLLTSLREGSPVVTKEALCCGTRVVSVDVGDLSEQLDGCSGCRLVAARDPRALATAVSAVLSEEPPSAEQAVSRFGVRQEVAATARVYESALGAR